MAPRDTDTQYFAAILDIRDTVTRTEQKLDDHLKNQQVHQVPPCEFAKEVGKRQWAAVVISLGALATAFFKTLWTQVAK